MPRSIVQYDLLISCPGDIKDELDIINNAVEKFNQQFSEALGISIRTRHWSKSSYAQSGGKPQNILNNQFVNDCDAAVAVFWTRFGTPTDDYGSGTEEEIENMLSSKKQVFMYFCEKPLPPAQMDTTGYKKVQEFKERYGKKGLYFEYRSNAEFDTLFFAHITEYFVSQKRIAAMTTNSPQLSVKGIVDSEVTSTPIVYPFLPMIDGKTPQDVMKEITDTFDRINNLHLEKKTNEIPFSSAVLALNTPVEIEANTEKKIKMIAEQLEIALEDDFFELGDLSKNSLSSSAALFGCSDQSLAGTTSEKKKYNLIMRLEALFSTFIGISEFNNSFKGFFALALCLDNSGSSYDEDIDITLMLPANALITPKEFPCKESRQKVFLLDECDMDSIFGIESTVNYMDYASSTKQYSHSSSIPSIYGRDIDEEFLNEVKDIFYYEFYQSGDHTYLKLHFDYIKQHTTVAFPSALILKSPIKNIEYEITSKHNPNVIHSILRIEERI